MSSQRVKLQDYLSGSCPYIGCLNNSSGICEIDNDEFIEELLDTMEDKSKSYFTCNNFTVKEGHCEQCGRELVESTDFLPYGDTKVPFTYYECPNC